MKKLVICSLLIILCLTLAACNKSVEFSVNFVVDGEVKTIFLRGAFAVQLNVTETVAEALAVDNLVVFNKARGDVV